MIEPRSWLLLPADSEKKVGKALESAADATTLDFEDSVAPACRGRAREAQKALPKRSGGPQWWMPDHGFLSEASSSRTTSS